MHHFDIRYADGRNSVAHDATLALMPDYWLIQYRDTSGTHLSVPWRLADIEAEQGFTNLLIFRYRGFPPQTLECKDESLRTALAQVYPQVAFFRKRRSTLAVTNSVIVGMVAVLLALLGLLYWYGLPFAAGVLAKRIPLSAETRIGDAMYDNMIRGYNVDRQLTPKVNDLAKSIRFQTPYPIRITVVKENDVNAFALPGGNIVVFDGILRKLKTKEELAALLAHEVSHVHYRHSLRNIFRSTGGYLFISLLLNDMNGIVAILAENSNAIANLTYSRDLETEADQKAMAIFREQGLDLKGFVDLFKLLQSETGDAEGLKLLSTHPLTEERLRTAREALKEQGEVARNVELEEKWGRISHVGSK